MQFLRQGSHTLVRPEVLGLPATCGQGTRVLNRARNQLLDALVAGDEEVCRQVIFDLYLAEHRISIICDAVIGAAFHEIGEKWECGRAEVYQERRACEIGVRVIHELRSVVSTPGEKAPVAIGGTPEGDSYGLATRMVELVLRDIGWNATSLGSYLPFATMEAAIRQVRPRLFWLSVSHIHTAASFLDHYRRLYETAAAGDVAVVVGGRALDQPIRPRMQYSGYCDTLGHLESFVASLANVPQRD